MTTDTEQIKIYEAFKRYPWETDKVFQEGLESILSQFPAPAKQEHDEAELLQDARLLQAKHFYFTRYTIHGNQDSTCSSYNQTQ